MKLLIQQDPEVCDVDTLNIYGKALAKILQKLRLRRLGVNDFQSKVGGFPLEGVDLPPAVLRFVELCA